eukprot:gene11090-3797_t
MKEEVKIDEVTDVDEENDTKQVVQTNTVEFIPKEKSPENKTKKQPHSWRFRFRQLLLFSSCFISYCVVFCFHAFLSVATPLLVASRVLTLTEISQIIFVAKLSRILPKLFVGSVIDFIGGKYIYIVSHGFLGVSLILCGIKPYNDQFHWIMLLLAAGTASSAMPWIGLLKMGTNWFDYRSMGKVMAGLSMSFLVGDAISRFYLGLWVRIGITWDLLFIVAGITMLVINGATSIFLSESPSDSGYEEEPEGDPRNILGEEGLKAGIEQDKIFHTFLPILKNPSIWILAIVYVGLTFMRYIANDWIVLYFVVRTGSSNELAATVSSIPPLFGALSVGLIGYLNDNLSTNLRNIVLFIYSLVCALICGAFFFLTIGSDSTDFYLSIGLFSAFSFFVLGPYSLPASAMSVEYGGKKINATLSGIFDGLSMLGAATSGFLGTLFFDKSDPKIGWDNIYLVSFIISIIISGFTLLFCLLDFLKSLFSKKTK